MSGISAVVIGTDQEQRTVLQMQIDGTAVAKTVHAFSAFPMAVSDAIVRRIQDLAANVIVVDIPRQSSASALRAIELLRNEIPESAIFAVGDVSQANVIISAMRAGASEFLERPTTTNGLLEAMIRLASAKRKGQDSSQRGKVFTFVNTKGGAGATTVAVNVACSLQRYGRTVLVDVAPLGHCALYLNLIPSFTLADALRNLQRIDYALLDTYLTEGANGLKVLAGAIHGSDQEEIVATDFASVLDLLVRNFDYVVVDASSRLDRLLRLVCNLSDRVLLVSQPDVPSFYNAAKMQEYLGEASDRKRISLILNRFRKLPGFQDTEIENATKTKILYRIPNQYSVVASSIERGIAAVIENHSDLGRAFASLASELSERPIESKARRAFSFFGA
jgi:pilus assembly protein CpaE